MIRLLVGALIGAALVLGIQRFSDVDDGYPDRDSLIRVNIDMKSGMQMATDALADCRAHRDTDR